MKIVILDDDNQPTDITDIVLGLTIIDNERLPEYVRRLLAGQVLRNKKREIVIDPSYGTWACGGGG